MQYPMHGANPVALYEAMGLKKPKEIVDVSENVNSFGLPQAVRERWPGLIGQISAYPDEQAEPFTSAVATQHHVPKEYVVAGNGAAEILVVLAQQFREQTVVLLEPSFSEYRRTLALYNCKIRQVIAKEITSYTIDAHELDEALQGASVIYICNPNNPTGVLMKRAWIEELLMKYPNVDVVVDEAFMDWTDEAETVISLVPLYERLIVLRSMTKMYGLAGVRLGYVVSQQAAKLRPFFPHWHVSSVAIELGMICLQQQAFVEASRARVDQLRPDMRLFFEQLGCAVTDSAANFFTFRLPEQFDADHFFKAMLTEGVVLRHTKNYVGLGDWFRIAVKNEVIWQRCKEAIERYVKNN